MPNSIHLVKLRELPDVANLPANTYHGFITRKVKPL
ncbi:hypothetical protein AAZX31_18G021600 [Glycine max]